MASATSANILDFDSRFNEAVRNGFGGLPSDFDDSSAIGLLGMDSLDLVEVLASLDEEFDIEMPAVEELGDRLTLGGLRKTTASLVHAH